MAATAADASTARESTEVGGGGGTGPAEVGAETV